MPVAEVFLGAFLQVFFDRLAPDNLSMFPSHLGIRSELKEWKQKLLTIQALLNDAEEKQLTNSAVKMWLDDLRDLAYHVEDILDEFSIKALERQADLEQQRNRFLAYITASNAIDTMHFNSQMSSKITGITSRLEDLCKLSTALGLRSIVGGASAISAWQRPSTTSLPTEPAVYGRAEDKSRILEMVLQNEPLPRSDVNFGVITIVGMAGVGKTTLARLVYNDPAVEDFNPKGWVCVSDDFDVLRISKAILESITFISCDLKDLNPVQLKLKEAIAGRKFLLVLDDVWNKDYGLWDILKAPFMAGTPGSTIIVTTRSIDVALTMGSVDYHNLKLLSDDDCWSVFVKHAFMSRDINPNQTSEFIRQKVVEKCKGLPLAARSLGGLLRCKQRDGEWEDILNSKIWDLSYDGEIPVVLKLSYHHLSSHLKRCFAYCAIFPKDYEFEKKEVVLLWMAEGLLQQSNNDQQLEDIGEEYFHDLLSRSLFQQVSSNGSKFIMHDLVNNLAQWAAGEASFRLEDVLGANNQLERYERARYSSYISHDFDDENKFEAFDKVEHLRTFFPIILHDGTRYIANWVLSGMLSKFKKLRVLSLRNYYFFELPDSFRHLTQLRYLNLSGTKISNVPEFVGSLFNLQVLLLRDCSRLKKLPKTIAKLINLRHLDVSGQNFVSEMPLGITKLKNLQTLSNFIVGLDTGSGLEDLKNLKFLRGNLCISRLGNVGEDIREVILSDKKDLQVLMLEWESIYLHNCSQSRRVLDKNVLDMLRPHSNLKVLSIFFYSGIRFPHWVGDPSFSNMVVLRLENCEKCISLPSIGALPSLKDLTIKGMRVLRSIGSEIYGDGCLKPFQSLETLCFQNLGTWENWDPMDENGHVHKFPVLKKLSILTCPRLSGKLPNHIPSLEELVIRGCGQLAVSFSILPLLCKLDIDDCKRMVSSRSMDAKSLKVVTLSNIPEFVSLSRHEFQKVECLKIIGCEELVHLWNEICLEEIPHELRSLASIRELFIGNCRSLLSFIEAYFLSNLRVLSIENCGAIRSLNEIMKHNYLHLKSLRIEGCHSLMFIVRGQLPSSLTKLEIKNCEYLQFLVGDREDRSASSSSGKNISENSLSLLESLDISGCGSLTVLSLRGQLSAVLKYLKIQNCPKLMSLRNQLPATVKHLEVQNCAELTTLSSTGQLPEALQYLSIADCPQLESIADRFDDNTALGIILIGNCKILQSLPVSLQNLRSLDQMYIHNCPSLVSLPDQGLPNTNLRILEISKCETLTALPNHMYSLSSLQELDISQCPRILFFPQEGLPTNLTSLSIEDPSLYVRLTLWGLHKFTSLKKLEIRRCPSAISFPDEELRMILPTSLTKLTIARFPRLELLSSTGFRRLNDLEYLSISDCPNLKSLPEWGLPSSLLQLYVEDCPLLAKKCERDWQEWSKIANIPCARIDHKFIHDPSSVNCLQTIGITIV